MMRLSIAIFILLEIIITFTKCDDDNDNEIKVSHRILEQKQIYGVNHTIYNTFIDFINFKMYNISKDRIFHKEGRVNFQLKWDDNKHITFGCFENDTQKIKCSDINLTEHTFTSFEYDRLISKIGGVISYLLILYGSFSLTKGYLYFNLTILFYGSFGFILLVREVFELLELKDLLSIETEKAENLNIIIFSGSLFTSLLYGFVCLNSKYLKYITFGFINGLFLSKLIFFYILKGLATADNITLCYFLLELFSVILSILLFIIFQNKYPKISIVYIVLMASYGIIYAANILFGGIIFIPYLILAKRYKSIEGDLYDELTKDRFHFVYLAVFVIFVFIGVWKNLENYKILMNRGKTK
jgi:hypothetical protein